MSSPKQVAGRAVEEAAEHHLAAAGLRPVAHDQVELAHAAGDVARDGEALVFVEVRYRRSASHGSAAESVSRTKRARLVAAARYFLMRNPKLSNLPCRFDVVAVDGEGEARRVEWLRDAFRLDG